MGAVIDVGAMHEAVDRLVDIQPATVEGMTDELHDEIHEAITKGMAWVATGCPATSNAGAWMVEHGYHPSPALIEAVGDIEAFRVLAQAWIERREIQDIFDGIDRMVVVVE